MHTSNLAIMIFVGLIVFGIPLTGPFERRIYRSDPATSLKFLAYGINLVVLWTLTAVAVRIDGLERLFARPAAGEAWLWAPSISSLALGLAAGAYVIVGFLPLIQSLRGMRWRLAYEAAIRRNFLDIPGLLPNTPTERAAWIALSFTAGICEEGLYRGFLIRFLHEGGVDMPLFAALVASSLIFGLAHVYQGARGVLATTIGGFALGLAFLLSGSLTLSIVLHVFMDLQLAYIVRPTLKPRGGDGLEAQALRSNR